MARHHPLSRRPTLALAMMAVVCAAASAQQPAALPNVPSCPPAMVTLSPCVSYFIGGASSPPTACCAQLQTMFQSQAPCFCAAMAGAAGQLGAVFGQVQALLPSACNVPANACTDVSGASNAPGGTPTPSSGTTVGGAAAPTTGPSAAVPTTPSGVGSKTIPSLLDSSGVGGCRGTSAAATASVMISLIVAFVSTVHAF